MQRALVFLPHLLLGIRGRGSKVMEEMLIKVEKEGRGGPTVLRGVSTGETKVKRKMMTTYLCGRAFCWPPLLKTRKLQQTGNGFSSSSWSGSAHTHTHYTCTQDTYRTLIRDDGTSRNTKWTPGSAGARARPSIYNTPDQSRHLFFFTSIHSRKYLSRPSQSTRGMLTFQCVLGIEIDNATGSHNGGVRPCAIL